jgi:SAM-dependent methyltransferase
LAPELLIPGNKPPLLETAMIDPEELPILEGYAAWAPFYDDDGNPLIAIEEPVLHGWFGQLETKKVLDLGCGTGRHTIPLAMAGASVVAVDGSDEMLARARHKLRGFPVEWARHYFPNPLPLDSEIFDLVVLALVAEHLDDLRFVLTEARRVTKPGGRLLLSVLHPDRTAQGQRARFIDPATGRRRQIATIHRSMAEYLAIAGAAGWTLVEERSLVVSPELGASLPRALPYVGMKLGWAACWRNDESRLSPVDHSGGADE